ncbi:MAG: endolytic transglycosylase MltG [Clostridiales bacterium]|nr:endolytic transglycosylase MltG [Clostridiales bacterium]
MPNPDNMEEAIQIEDVQQTEGPAEFGPDTLDPDQQKKKKRALPFVSLLLLLLALGAAGGVFGGRYLQAQRNNWLDDLEPVSPPGDQEIIFTLERGWTLSRTAEALYANNLIRSAESFIRLGKQENQAESLKAGRFLLSSSMSSAEILDELVKGSVLTARFTIPEGYTLRQIAKVLDEKGIAKEEAFWACVRDTEFDFEFLEGLPADEHRLEGYLFPDTYIIELDEPVETVLARMLSRYAEIWASLPTGDTGLNDREMLILASIVQNEVKLDEERPTVAGVFMNRLNTNMLLQSCSTVQYYFEEPKFPLLTADTQIDYPYNTYLYSGLPPGPVGSPGKASLEAAIFPEDTEYLYFVAREDGSGGHYFSRTLSEHNQASARAKANR